jgi:hypothetical protein
MNLETERRAAQVRIRAKKFANLLRGEARGWAMSIPEEDIQFLKDEEIREYMEVLISKNLHQRDDLKWEAI